MPYIKDDNRKILDQSITSLTEILKTCACSQSLGHPYKSLSNEEFLNIVGDINYVFSRVISGLMGDRSYPKIAMITGVLENIKQEYYRRVASVYEDKKIVENGDIPEYSKPR